MFLSDINHGRPLEPIILTPPPPRRFRVGQRCVLHWLILNNVALNHSQHFSYDSPFNILKYNTVCLLIISTNLTKIKNAHHIPPLRITHYKRKHYS